MNTHLNTFILPGFLLGCGLLYAEEACQPPTSQPTIESLLVCAERGDAQAQLMLGQHYQSQKGASDSFYLAANWYRKAAEQGNPEAQFQLGILYLDGLGITEDAATGFEWISQAALNGHPGATEVFNYLLDNPQPMEC